MPLRMRLICNTFGMFCPGYNYEKIEILRAYMSVFYFTNRLFARTAQTIHDRIFSMHRSGQLAKNDAGKYAPGTVIPS